MKKAINKTELSKFIYNQIARRLGELFDYKKDYSNYGIDGEDVYDFDYLVELDSENVITIEFDSKNELGNFEKETFEIITRKL